MSKSIDKEMSFLDHLEVFRWHLIRSATAILFFAIISFIFKNIIFDKILLAPREPSFITYEILCFLSNLFGFNDALCLSQPSFSLMNISMSGQFSVHIYTSILAGFILAFPYIFWEFWCFIKPALYKNETKIIKGVVFYSSLLFLLGVLFGYFVIAPISINFLGSYQISSTVANQISITSFISTVTTVTLANGIIFELPILVYFLTKVGLVTPTLMRNYRRHSIILILILSAIITPPDIASQIIVSIPLLVLYEISISISSRIIKKTN